MWVMFGFIKRLFKKKEVQAVRWGFSTEDVKGQKIMIYDNKIVSPRAPTKKDWKFEPDTQWYHKGDRYVIRHIWVPCAKDILSDSWVSSVKKRKVAAKKTKKKGKA